MTRQVIERECPECGATLHAKAKRCGCGWKAEIRHINAPAGLPQIPGKSEGIVACAWEANGEQCHYPGTISRNTTGAGPWFCRFHSEQDISQEYGAQVVEQSRKYIPRNMQERDAEARSGERKPKLTPAVIECFNGLLGKAKARALLTGLYYEQSALVQEPGQDDEEVTI